MSTNKTGEELAMEEKEHERRHEEKLRLEHERMKAEDETIAKMQAELEAAERALTEVRDKFLALSRSGVSLDDEEE